MRSLLKRKPAEPKARIVMDRFMGNEEARALAAAISAGDWDQVGELGAPTKSPSVRRHAMWAQEGKTDLPGVDERIAESGLQDQPALLARGLAGIVKAWEFRGSGGSETVTQEGWIQFADCLRKADLDLHRAARLAPKDPVPWVGLLCTARGLQIPIDEVKLRFKMLRLRDQDNLDGHSQYLQGIAGKWGGDDVEMWRFAVAVHEAVPPGSPLRQLVAEAFLECFLLAGHGVSVNETQILHQAANASVFHPEFAKYDHLERQSALTLFASVFYVLKAKEQGARIVEMIGEFPNPSGYWHVDQSDDPAVRWDKLKRAFE